MSLVGIAPLMRNLLNFRRFALSPEKIAALCSKQLSSK